MEKAIFFLIIFASNYIVVQLFMITSEFLNLLEITESDLQFDLRGYYSTSFFHVYLEGEFDTDIKRLSIKDRGTFIHEYIHYFQNIGTYWGLYCSIIRYHEMLEFKAQIIDSDIIEIPLNLNYSEKLRAKIEWVKAGNGLSVYNSNLTWNINKEHKIEIKQTDSNICGRNRPQIYLNIMFDDGRVESVDFGAHIIKESMAALYQSLVDASVLHNDVPYNIVKLVCEQYFPNIANDVEKLICLCYTSLFSMSPGSELFSLLKVASENIQTNGVDLFTNFIDSKTITTSQGKTHTVVDFFDILINGFKRTLSTNLVADLDYIDNVLDRVKLSNKWIPFLSVLYDQNKLSIENINAIIGFIGIPDRKSVV